MTAITQVSTTVIKILLQQITEWIPADNDKPVEVQKKPNYEQDTFQFMVDIK